MKKVQEIFKEHGDWFGAFVMSLIVWAVMAGLFLGLVSRAPHDTYVPFNDLKIVRITNVIYADNDSDAYVEGMTEGNRKIHIDVDNGEIPSNFKNTKTAVVYETSDKELYLNQKDYDEANPKVSKADLHKLWAMLIVSMAIAGIVVSAFVATIFIKDAQSVAKRTN